MWTAGALACVSTSLWAAGAPAYFSRFLWTAGALAYVSTYVDRRRPRLRCVILISIAYVAQALLPVPVDAPLPLRVSQNGKPEDT